MRKIVLLRKSELYMIKLRFCDKGTKILQNHHLTFVLCSNDQIYCGVLQNFVAFSKYMNFNIKTKRKIPPNLSGLLKKPEQNYASDFGKHFNPL